MKNKDAWERWGSLEPYYAVLAEGQYLAQNMGDAQRTAFFRSGAGNVHALLETYKRLRGGTARFGSALDFGCGVGRLTIPLAQSFEAVTGVDVSQSMLQEARENCARAGIENVQLVQTSDFLSRQDAGFDLVFSVLVLQHIRPRAGIALLTELLSRLAPGGMAAVQLIFAERFTGKVLAGMRSRAHLLRRFWYALRNKSLVAPMEMNPYDLGAVLSAFQNHGLTKLEVSLERMGDIRSVTLVGIKRDIGQR